MLCHWTCNDVGFTVYGTWQGSGKENQENNKGILQREETGLSNQSIGIVGIGVSLALTACVGLMCTSKIAPGYAGVVYNMDGGIESEVLGQGFHAVAPWKHVVEYPVSTETVYYSKTHEGDKEDDKKDTSINVNTKDGKQVNVSVTYAFHMDAGNLPAVFTKFRGQPTEAIVAGYMKNEMYQAINEVTSQYSLMDLVGDKRPAINEAILSKFRASLEEYGIMVETFNLSDVVPDEATKDAIQKVVNAQNVLEQAKIERQTAEIVAEKKRVEAEGEAKAAIIRADGQAQANAKLQQSLTELIVKQQAIEKWKGDVPQVMSSSDGVLFNIPMK